ncbi:TetR/AcrR family transcriptional regulator C-terminal domain-containing protein [Streptomyces nigrescens]
MRGSNGAGTRKGPIRPDTLTIADSLLAAMREAGFTGEAAVWAITTVFSYVKGEALEQQGRTEVDLEEVQATLRRGLPAPGSKSTAGPARLRRQIRVRTPDDHGRTPGGNADRPPG